MHFTSMLGIGQLVGYGLSVMIVAQSLMARMGFIQLTKLIKFTSNSSRMTFIVICVFTIYFINYGVLYVIVPLKVKIPIVSNLLVGVYWDFNMYWYTDIGYQVISVLVIVALFPPLEFVGLWFWDVVKRSWDQGRCWRKKEPTSTR